MYLVYVCVWPRKKLLLPCLIPHVKSEFKFVFLWPFGSNKPRFCTAEAFRNLICMVQSDAIWLSALHYCPVGCRQLVYALSHCPMSYKGMYNAQLVLLICIKPNKIRLLSADSMKGEREVSPPSSIAGRMLRWK